MLRNAEAAPSGTGVIKKVPKASLMLCRLSQRSIREEHQQQADFERTEEFNAKMKVRYKIEAKNAELKNVFGYDRADSYGLDCMRMQGAMVIFAANIKRILRLS